MSQDDQFDKLKGKLQPIQIGDVAGQDAFMSIETNSIKDDTMAIFLFLCVVFTTTIAGIYGPGLFVPGSVQTHFDDQKSLHQTVNNLAPINRFLSLSLIFTSNKEVTNPNLTVKYAFALTFKQNGNEKKRSDGQSEIVLSFEKDKLKSKPIQFYYDRVINFDEVSINVEFDETKELSSGILYWKYGDQNHTVFQTWVRFVFALTTVIITALFVFRLHMVAKQNWNIEQKFTVIYLVVSVIGCNVFYVILLFIPSLITVVFDCVLNEIFVGFTWFFMLVIIDSFRLSNTPEKTCFYEPKLILMTCRIIIGTIVAIDKEIGLFSPQITQTFSIIQIIVIIIFILYFVILILLTFSSINSTTLHSYVVYSIIFSFTIIFHMISPLLDSFPVKNTSGSFSMSFSTLHCLTILMAYFHWPYEPSVDQQYNEADEIDQNDEGFEPEIDEARINQKENTRNIESNTSSDDEDDEEVEDKENDKKE